MANGDTIPPVRDPDLEEEARAELARRRGPAYYGGATDVLPAIPRRSNMATGETALAQTPPLPRAEEPNYMPAIPRPPMTPVEQDEQREAVLKGKVFPEPKPTRLGRAMHTLNVVGQDIGTALEPQIMQNIPGTIASNRADLFATQNRLGRERQEEAQAGEAKTRLGLEERRVSAEERAANQPKLLEGQEYTQGGRRWDLYKWPSGKTGYAETGTIPVEPGTSTEPLPGAAVAGPILSGTRAVPTPPPPAPEGTLQRVGAQQPMAAPGPYGLPAGGTFGKPPTKNEEEQFIDKWLQENQKPDTAANRSLGRDEYRRGAGIGEERARQIRTQIENNLKPYGIDPAGYMVSATSKADDAKEALAASQRAASDARLAAAPGKAEEIKSRHTWGYSEDANGQTIWTNEAAAGSKKMPFQPAPQGQGAKDRSAIGQVSDAQMNVSRYTKAARDYDAAVTNGQISAAQMVKDQTELHNLLNKAGLFDLKLKGVLELDLPFIGALSEALTRESKSRSYDMLTPQGQALYNGYLRTVASVPAYQKMLTETGRTNKEMLDLELATIANPSMGTTAILERQQAFQENIDRAAKRLPINLPGLEKALPTDVRTQIEGQAPGVPPGTPIRNYNQKTKKFE